MKKNYDVPFCIDSEHYPEPLKRLLYYWYIYGIWRRYNWYDFLKELLDIYKNYDQRNRRNSTKYNQPVSKQSTLQQTPQPKKQR